MAKAYQSMYHVSMEADIKDDMEGHEMERAKALMEGKSSEANAAAIKEAVDGLGTDEAAIKNALRGKSKEELKEIKAEYKRMYEVELKADLADDMEDAELDNALALVRRRPRQGRRGRAVGRDGRPRHGRGEAQEGLRADPRGGGGQGQVGGPHARRAQAADPGPQRQGQGAVQREVRRPRREDAGRAHRLGLEGELDGLKGLSRLVQARGRRRSQARGGAAVGRRRPDRRRQGAKEHEGVYTSDDEIENVVRNQRKQAELDVGLDLAAKKARIEALARSGDITEERQGEAAADWETESKDREEKVSAKAKENLGKLSRPPTARRPTAARPSTSWSRTRRRATPRTRSATSSPPAASCPTRRSCTTRPPAPARTRTRSRRSSRARPPDEINKIRKAYADKHPGHTLDGDLLGDLSGREDLDVGHTLQYGDPETFARQLEEAKTPEDRKKLIEGMKKMLDERQKFEQTGTIGQIFALGADPMNSADAAEGGRRQGRGLRQGARRLQGEHPEREARGPGQRPGAGLGQGQLRHELQRRPRVPGAGPRSRSTPTRTSRSRSARRSPRSPITIATAGTAGPVMAALYGALARRP